MPATFIFLVMIFRGSMSKFVVNQMINQFNKWMSCQTDSVDQIEFNQTDSLKESAYGKHLLLEHTVHFLYVPSTLFPSARSFLYRSLSVCLHLSWWCHRCDAMLCLSLRRPLGSVRTWVSLTCRALSFVHPSSINRLPIRERQSARARQSD